jgi:hypothetical protein
MRTTVYIRRKVNGKLVTVPVTVEHKKPRVLIAVLDRLKRKHKLMIVPK